MGGPIDCESETVICEVKERSRMSLQEIEGHAVRMEQLGAQKFKAGIVCIKRSAGRGHETPMLIVMTASTFRLMNGPLPSDAPAEDDGWWDPT
jgi:hypothetical protein